MFTYADDELINLQGDASILGGVLTSPEARTIPTVGSVSLPPVGGEATSHSSAYILDNIVGFSAAYSHVSGSTRTHGQAGAGGSKSSTLTLTAVVENLNIRDVVKARRITTKVTFSISDDDDVKYLFSGSSIEGLQIASIDCHPQVNSRLLLSGSHVTSDVIGEEARAQAEELIKTFDNSANTGGREWATRRRQSAAARGAAVAARCSLFDGLETDGRPEFHRHIVELPGYGRFFFGEVHAVGNYVQVIGVRAELGCPVAGRITVACVGGNGKHS
jgi:hypothetical protein